MPRLLCAAIVCGSLLFSAHIAQGDQSTSKAAATRRAEVERILDQPLEWDIGDRETVTIEDFIAHVKERHQLEVHWDAGAMGLLGSEGIAGLLEDLLGSVINRAPIYAVRSSGPLQLTLVSDSNGGEKAPPAEATAPVSAPQAIAVPVAPDALPDPLPPAVAPASAVPVPIGAAPACPACAAPAAASPSKLVADAEEPSFAMIVPKQPIRVSSLSFEQATVREALEQLLSAAIPPAFAGLVTTKSLTLDYVVEGRSVAITTTLSANATKETRVYRISQINGIQPDELSRVIQRSIRPWSWREQPTQIAERLAAKMPKGKGITLPKFGPTSLEVLGMEGVTVTSASSNSSEPPVLPAGVPPTNPAPDNEISEEDISAAAQFLSGGAIAFYQGVVETLEVVHYGDPPTAVIEVLPGRLIITQSQSAHREIAELLDQLSETAPAQ